MRLAMLSDVFGDDLQLSDLYKAYKDDELTTERRASNLLYDLMLPPNYKGYKYLKEAIIMLCDDVNAELGSFNKYIYPTIATKFNTTPKNVERNIRFAVSKIYAINSEDELKDKLGISPDVIRKLTNVKFIAFCAEKLRLER